MIPLTKDEITDFIPASLSNVAAAPVFLFRPATKRDAQTFERLCMIEGLRLHDQESFRICYRHALNELSSPQEAEDAMAILEALWAKADQGVPAEDSEVLAAVTLIDSLERNYQPLRVMNADNHAFFKISPVLALSLFLVGWRNIDVEFKRSEGQVPLDLFDAIQARLKDIETQAVKDKVAGVKLGDAWLQLQTHALDLLNMTRAEAGKSPSLSPAPSIQNGSEVAGSPAATSPAPSTKTTPPRKSGKPIST